MPDITKSLWPTLPINAATPYMILDEQVRAFEEQANGLVKCKVNSSLIQGEKTKQHQMELCAPRINYTVKILVAEHAANEPYPVSTKADCFREVSDIDAHEFLKENPDATWLKNTATIAKILTARASTPLEFMGVLRFVFHSEQVRGILASMMARTNEQILMKEQFEEKEAVKSS